MARKEERRLKAWLQTRRVAIFIDESAKIKNPDTALTQVYHHLSPYFAKRVIMTGTPVANRPYDIWSQIYFLDQGTALGTDYSTFKREHDFDKLYATDRVAFDRYQSRLASIFERVAKISIRETKDGGRIVLPTKEFARIQTDWERGQRDLYLQVKEELRAVVLRDGELIEDGQESILKRLLRLIQIASHPGLVDEGYHSEPGKLLVLRDLITDITRQGEKAIVWTSFIQNADWLAKALSPFGSLALHGKLPMDRRNAVVKWFSENPSDRVLSRHSRSSQGGIDIDRGKSRHILRSYV
ncbi:MAG: DEAD/DEAH box helicase [Betaproteobacteria bacterium]|nr:DEAD/DEAH box helicase [Betaproteobacteria bacterium]